MLDCGAAEAGVAQSKGLTLTTISGWQQCIFALSAEKEEGGGTKVHNGIGLISMWVLLELVDECLEDSDIDGPHSC